MAGRYIINQTAGKRVVILDEDNDKVEGGYFNTDGTWVSFGVEDGMIYKGKTFKIKETPEAAVSSTYTILPIFVEFKEPVSAKKYGVDLYMYSTKMIKMYAVSDTLRVPVFLTFVDGDGNRTEAGVNTKFYLPYGIIPEMKTEFDKSFEEVTEE